MFLLGLRDAARDPATADRPATRYVPVIDSEVLGSWRHGEVRPEWTVWEFYWALGRLGGHQNRKNGPPPGWLVLSRGWTLLRTMVEGVEAMGRSRAGTAAPEERPDAGPLPENVRDAGVT